MGSKRRKSPQPLVTPAKLAAEYRYIMPQRDGWLRVWNTATCDHCGAECLGPNSYNVAGEGLYFALLGCGMRRRDPAGLSELGWSDELEGAVCTACYDAARKE